MDWIDSTKHGVLLLAFLVLSGSLSCCKSYVRPHIPRCPKISEMMVMEMMTVTDSPTVDYVADELIPYCQGIDAMRNE